MHLAHGQRVIAQGLAGVRGRVHTHLFGRAFGDDQATCITAFRAQVDQPVAGTDHVQVVLDDDQGVATLQQFTQRTHQLGDVVKVQARGRLVKQKQSAFATQRLAAGRGGFGGARQEARQLQTLCLTPRQGGHGLAQLDVFQADIDDGLQRTDHIAVMGKQLRRFAHRQIQHIGHVHVARVQRTQGLALDGDFEDFRAVAFAVAVLAAQIHIAQELHFHMLKARTATSGAAPIAAVETELAGGVAALLGQTGGGEQLAQRIPSAHIADRVGARGFADRRLVDKHHIAQMISAEQAVVQTRRLCGFAKVAEQGRGQHVLNQTGLARTGHTRHTHQALQRKFDRDVLQVVLAHAFQNQARCAVGHHALKAHAHLLATAQIGAGHGVGQTQFVGRAVEHDLPAFFAGARPHVDHAVGGQHHRRVVLHHHQGVAGITQAVHGLGDAAHVARVQADAGLVQHKQGVDQRGTQGGGQVDALHLAATQCAALSIQCQVTNAHIAQILQTGGDLLQQKFERLRLAVRGQRGQGRVRHAIEKTAQAVQRHQHQIMQAQARQGFQLCPRPTHALRHEALRWRQHGVGIFQSADAPNQTVRLQARAAAIAARGVAAVFGQQHADVHLVRLGFQVLKKTLDAVPLLVPFSRPVGRTLNHPMLLLGGELVPSGIARNAGGFGVAHQVVLAFFPCRCLDGFDDPGAEREFVVRNHQAIVHANHPAKAPAGVASPQRGIEREHRRQRLGVAQIALRAMQSGGIAPQFFAVRFIGRQFVDVEAAAAAFQSRFNGFHHAGFVSGTQPKTVGHHIQHFARAGGGGHFALSLHFGESAGRQPLLDLLGAGIGRQLHREGDHHPRIMGSGRARQHLRVNALGRVVLHRPCGLPVVQLAQAREQQLQVVIQLGHGAHGGARTAHRVGLVNRNRRRHALHLVHRRFVHAVQKLARIGTEGFHIAPLPLGVQRIEHQTGFARTAGPGDHGQLAGADVQIDVFQVVLACTANANKTLGHGVVLCVWGLGYRAWI